MPQTEVRLFINPADVIVGDRQREEVEDIDKLAASMERFGQFHPITLESDHKTLNKGFRRLCAAMVNGWDKIWYTTINREGVDEADLIEEEIEENIQRQQMTWQEVAKAIAKIDEIRSRKDPTWNREKTADLMNVSRQTVYNSIELAKAIEEDPDVASAETLTGALSRLTTKKKIAARREEIELRSKGLLNKFEAEIKTGDALALIRKEPDESFDAIITNCPFGVDLEYRGGLKPYEDDEDDITSLIMELAPEWYRVLKPDSWGVFFFDLLKISHNTYTINALKRTLDLAEKYPDAKQDLSYLYEDLYRSAGLTHWLKQAGFSYVTTLPHFWVKPNKTQGMLGNANRGFVVAYEAFVFAAKGDPALIQQGKQNIWIYDTPAASDRVFSVQMSEDICYDILKTITVSGGRVLDTFAGSGASGRAALRHQCHYVGFELDAERAKNGNMRLKEAMLGTHEEETDLSDILLKQALSPSA